MEGELWESYLKGPLDNLQILRSPNTILATATSILFLLFSSLQWKFWRRPSRTRFRRCTRSVRSGCSGCCCAHACSRQDFRCVLRFVHFRFLFPGHTAEKRPPHQRQKRKTPEMLRVNFRVKTSTYCSNGWSFLTSHSSCSLHHRQGEIFQEKTALFCICRNRLH